MSDENLEQPHALPHVPTETVYISPAPSSLAAPAGSADSLRADVLHLLNEVNCRIEHGANSNKHLEYVEACLRQILEANPPNNEIRRPGPDAPEQNPRRQPGSPASNG